MDVELLSLPEEILETIAGHFTLTEWVRGPARTCHALHRMKLSRMDLNLCRAHPVRPEGTLYSVYCWLQMGSIQMSSALACADRHFGPSTTSISLTTLAVPNSLFNTLISPSILANVACLELILKSTKFGEDDFVTEVATRMMQKVPNLIAARLEFGALSKAPPFMPLLRLKHLELDLGVPPSFGSVLESLEGMPFATLFPSLETARISSHVHGGAIPQLDVSGCRHLTRLVLRDLIVYQLLKPPRCTIRIETVRLRFVGFQPNEVQPGLSEVAEASLCGEELYSTTALIATVQLPNLKVIRCEGWKDNHIRDDEWDGEVANSLVNCMRHSSNIPALKSILCRDSGCRGAPMKVVIPAHLAGVQELMFATNRRLLLAFESARSAGERLSTFFAAGSEVRFRMHAADLAEMLKALSERGLTLSVVRAPQGHERAPSQCVYAHACSAPRLSYEDAMASVHARLERWPACSQCGACFACLRKAGVLDSK